MSGSFVHRWCAAGRYPRGPAARARCSRALRVDFERLRDTRRARARQPTRERGTTDGRRTQRIGSIPGRERQGTWPGWSWPVGRGQGERQLPRSGRRCGGRIVGWEPQRWSEEWRDAQRRRQEWRDAQRWPEERRDPEWRPEERWYPQRWPQERRPEERWYPQRCTEECRHRERTPVERFGEWSSLERFGEWSSLERSTVQWSAVGRASGEWSSEQWPFVGRTGRSSRRCTRSRARAARGAARRGFRPLHHRRARRGDPGQAQRTSPRSWRARWFEA